MAGEPAWRVKSPPVGFVNRGSATFDPGETTAPSVVATVAKSAKLVLVPIRHRNRLLPLLVSGYQQLWLMIGSRVLAFPTYA